MLPAARVHSTLHASHRGFLAQLQACSISRIFMAAPLQTNHCRCLVGGGKHSAPWCRRQRRARTLSPFLPRTVEQPQACSTSRSFMAAPLQTLQAPGRGGKHAQGVHHVEVAVQAIAAEHRCRFDSAHHACGLTCARAVRSSSLRSGRPRACRLQPTNRHAHVTAEPRRWPRLDALSAITDAESHWCM